TDQAMFDPSGDGSDGAPVSLIYNLTPIANDGTLEGAVEAAVGAFKGDLSRAIWAIEPQTAARVGITSGGRGMAVDLGARGGTLAGLAAYASVGMPRDELVLIDPGRV